jgi:hypothetical protein
MLKDFLEDEKQRRQDAMHTLLSKLAAQKDSLALNEQGLKEYQDEADEVSLQTEWLNTLYHQTLSWQIERHQNMIEHDQNSIDVLNQRIADTRRELEDIDYELSLNG